MSDDQAGSKFIKHLTLEDPNANGIFTQLMPCEGPDLRLAQGRDGRSLPLWYPAFDRRLPPRIADVADAALYPDGSFRCGEYYAYTDFLFVPQTHNIMAQWTTNARFVEATDERGMVKLQELPARRISGTALSLQSPHFNNFGHFIFDVLPRVIYYDRCVNHIDKVVVSPCRFQIQQKLLELLFPGAKFIEQSAEIIEADRFLIPSNPCQSYAYCPEPLDYLRSRLLAEIRSHFGIASGRACKVFVSRRDGRPGTSRDVLSNTDEIEHIARRSGYEVVEVSKLEPVDQLELFISAKAIAGVHGAGLMNMIFMSREARYVEITLDPQPHWVYRLAERYFQERAVIACQLDGSVMTCPISQLEEVL